MKFRETEQLKIEVVKLEEQIKKDEIVSIDSPAEEMIKVMQKLKSADGTFFLTNLNLF
jgi:uncharacterized FlaG/YvyC family protein